MAKSKASGKASSQSEFSQPKRRRPFTVFLIVDDRTLRESLAEVLKSEKVDVQDYMTAMEFYRDYREAKPGVLVTEIQLRGMSGMELFEKVEADKIDLPVAFIAGHADSPLAIQGMKAGAFDFMTKPVKGDQLMALVARGYATFYDVDWDFVGEDLDDIEKSITRVTGREREILDLVVDGHSSRTIAEQLGISTKTVEAHRARINDKMRSDDLPHLVRMVLASRDAKLFRPAPREFSRGSNWSVCHNLFITQKPVANPLRFRFRFRGLPTPHDLLSLGFRHANTNVQGLYFCLWFFGTAFHHRQCSQ